MCCVCVCIPSNLVVREKEKEMLRFEQIRSTNHGCSTHSSSAWFHMYVYYGISPRVTLRRSFIARRSTLPCLSQILVLPTRFTHVRISRSDIPICVYQYLCTCLSIFVFRWSVSFRHLKWSIIILLSFAQRPPVLFLWVCRANRTLRA